MTGGSKRGGLATGIFAAALFGIALAACSLWPLDSQEAAKTETLWSRGNQYVRLEPLDGYRDSPPAPNWHPVEFSPREIRNALQRVGVKSGAEAQPAPLFSLKSLDTLSQQISAGLAKATPGQDVTFAVEQRYPGRPGGNTPQVVSGRVFYVGNWLNVIFGSVLRPVAGQAAAAGADPRYNAYAPGARAYSLPQPLSLWTAPESGAYPAPGESHKTWLLFSRQSMSTPPPPMTPRKPPERTPAGTRAAPLDRQQ